MNRAGGLGSVLTAMLLAPLAALHAADNPLPSAQAVWRMTADEAARQQPFALKANGPVKFEPLSLADAAESRKRGGADVAVTLTPECYLWLDPERTQRLRPSGDVLSLYVRAWLAPDAAGTFFFSDFAGLAIHPSGLAIAFLGVKTAEGTVGRELPLAMVEKGRWLDLILRVGDGRLDFFCDGVLRRTLPLRQSLGTAFADKLLIGAWGWLGTEKFRETGTKKIASVALWHRAISDCEVAFLSGAGQLAPSGGAGPFDQAILDYNAFFDASLAKDVATCGKLSRALREFAARDPGRPVYHLTQPLGWIFDPAGAYFHGGRYHVFSYHNIYALLTHCSLDHYVSDDLVRWTEWPIGPWADSSLDRRAIFLMNHFLDDRGVPTVLYTAFGAEPPFKSGVLARSRDGLVSYGEKKRVLTNHHDGHTWREGDTWYTITRDEVKRTQFKGERPGKFGDDVILYSSHDLENWQERGQLFARPKEKTPLLGEFYPGFMEFPYLIPFGDKDVLILGGIPVRYWVGRFDRQKAKFIADQSEGLLLDYTNPFHCFNPLAVDAKGPGGGPRRIIMAMYKDISGGGGAYLPWNGVHALPRTLEFDGRHLRQEPLPEFESLRGEHESKQNITLKPDTKGLIRTRADAVEINAEFEPGDAQRFGLKLRVSDDGARFVRVWFDTATGDYGVDGQVLNEGAGPSYLVRGQPVRMRVFVDKQVVEAFVNGQTCTTIAQVKDTKASQPALSDGLDLFSEGGTARCTTLDVWKMNRAEPK